MGTYKPSVAQQLGELSEKFQEIGQPLEHQLEGLVHAKPINYWDYIQTDALLNLQVQRTILPDEMVFIMYHQINELLFKMILWELQQIADVEVLKTAFFTSKLGRISRYFDMLTASFTIMGEGMDMEQYLKFRRTLSPASGFQSAQYRQIEFASTELINLIDNRFRKDFSEKFAREQRWEDVFYDEAFEHLYWQAAGKDFSTGKKTYTLQEFEQKYKGSLLRYIKTFKNVNLYSKFRTLPQEAQQDPQLQAAMRHYDHTVNIKWVMAHYGAARHYLSQGKKPLEATGGSEWTKYMHPKYQKRVFFPSLWSAEELENWGKEV
ncbi:tryptophan 2,3-dioxygenase family protein [Flavimarina sp. Hel_I_48]|uniref:tryptophan 2,3-dioxygenase family protein n=1 Tax=Flavimarina sp. Hel_I_48 TaxID=1392488 RepID=UPI0004DEE7CE|nr:tryptophan 2,3-dioxygenase family protein [Flavimarina sp. Hel_I_48]